MQGEIEVSILVLMEVKREPGTDAFPALLKASFNPCFDGSEARARALRLIDVTVDGFNPCFDGSEARGTAFRACNGKIMRFNPCFDGSEARGKTVGQVTVSSPGFNPCFDGSEAREREERTRQARENGFQSLF